MDLPFWEDDPSLMSASTILSDLKDWLEENGGYFHPHVYLQKVSSGFSVIASQNLPPDSKIVSCPFTLAITKQVALDALSSLLGFDTRQLMGAWTERQLISSYICFHLIEDAPRMTVLKHHPYVNSLPSREKLRTPLHFMPHELELFKGSNLYGATLDREREWRAEWEQCRAIVANANAEWGEQLTWELYLTAATHLSSRAFGSALLLKNMTLTSPADSDPILLPGIDSLNHARAEPVSWVQNYVGSGETAGPGSNISLTLHNPVAAGAELFNNYGVKPNSELILGYGFSFPNNPDDTIVLKIGGMEGKKWEVGRNARGADGVWENVLQSVAGGPLATPTYEDHLDAAETLADMARVLLEKLPQLPPTLPDDVREDVALMFKHYVEGQRDIIESLVEYANLKEVAGVEMAREEGIELVLE